MVFIHILCTIWNCTVQLSSSCYKTPAFSSNEPEKVPYLSTCMTRHLQRHLFICGILHIARYFQEVARMFLIIVLILINSTPIN